MKKLIFVFLALITSAGLFAQGADKAAATELVKGEEPKEIVTTTTEEVYAEITPEKEAEELTELLSQGAEFDEAKKKKIYDIVLKALKEKVKIKSLREESPEKYAAKEMEIFKAMNESIKVVFTEE